VARRGPLIAAEAGIIPALDLDDAERLKRIVAATCEVEGVVGYKLGAVIALRLGLGPAIDAVRQLTDLPVLYADGEGRATRSMYARRLKTSEYPRKQAPIDRCRG